ASARTDTTRAQIRTASTKAITRTGTRWPWRSAKRAMTRPPNGSPKAKAPESSPAAATLPVCKVTSVSMPIKDIDTGSRAKKVANSKGHHVVRCMCRWVAKGDIDLRADQWRHITSTVMAREPGRGEYSGTRRQDPQALPVAVGA